MIREPKEGWLKDFSLKYYKLITLKSDSLVLLKNSGLIPFILFIKSFANI